MNDFVQIAVGFAVGFVVGVLGVVLWARARGFLARISFPLRDE